MNRGRISSGRGCEEGKRGKIGEKGSGAELLTKERDSVTDKSGKLAEEAEERERNRTGETGSKDTKGTQ